MGFRLQVSLLLTFSFVLSFTAVNSKLENKINLDVYVESLCPDSRKFILMQLWPAYQNLENWLNLRLIPYGNAEVRDGPGYYLYKCQHGPDECYGNIAQTCAIEIMNNTKKSLEFAVCAFHYNTQSGVVDKCIDSEEVRSKVKFCTEGPMGNRLEYKMAKLTESLNPPQTFIPWITINGKGSKSINNQAIKDLVSLICEYIKDDPPKECMKYKGTKRDIYRRYVGL